MDHETDTTLLAAVFQNASHAIAFFKRQQVVTTTYVVAVHFGSIALVRNVTDPDGLRGLLWLTSMSAVVVGYMILYHLEKSIHKSRCRLEQCKDEFPGKLQEIIKRRSEEETPELFVYAVLLVSQALSLWLVTAILIRW